MKAPFLHKISYLAFYRLNTHTQFWINILVNLMNDFRFMPSWYRYWITYWMFIWFSCWENISKSLTQYPICFRWESPIPSFAENAYETSEMRHEIWRCNYWTYGYLYYNRVTQVSHFLKLNLPSESMTWTLELHNKGGSLSHRLTARRYRMILHIWAAYFKACSLV